MTDADVTCEVWRGEVYVPFSQELMDETARDRINELMRQEAEAAERDPEAFMMGVLAAANREMGI